MSSWLAGSTTPSSAPASRRCCTTRAGSPARSPGPVMAARSPGRPGPGSGLGPGRGPVVAIIGGGASGTLAAIHLLREATARQYPLSIALIDRLGRHGLGEAYST